MKQIFTKYFTVFCAIIVVLITNIFSSPNYTYLSSRYRPLSTWCNMTDKIERKNHMLESVSDKYEGSSHMAKTEFRLTVPLLAKIFLIDSKPQMYILQLIAGVLFFFLLSSLILKLCDNKTIAFLFCLSFGFIYPGYVFVAETEGYFDCFGYLFLLIAMLDIPIIFIGLVLLLAFFNDERNIVASSLIVFWWQYRASEKSLRNFFLPTKQSITLIGSIVIYCFCRWYLINHFGFKNQFGGTGLSILASTLRYAGLGFWQAFEGFWLIIVLALYFLYVQKRFFIGLTLIALNGIIFLVGLMVLDITKSMSYMFPTIVIAFYIIRNNIELELFKKYIAITLLFCFFYPSYYFIARTEANTYYPIYIRIAKSIVRPDE